MDGISGRARFLLLLGVPALVLVLVVFVAGRFGGSESGSSGGQADGTVVWGIPAEPDSLDPQKMNLGVSYLVATYASDPLIYESPDGDYVPGLARSWEQSNDGLTWTFELKKNVRFHDGTPLDAAAVKASFERILDPDTGAGVATTLVPRFESISTPSAYTLKMDLEEPFPAFRDYLTNSYLAPVNVAAAEEMGDEFGRRPIMTGPWKVESWRSGDRVVLERNPDYDWGPPYAQKGPPGIDRMVFRFMPDSATRTSAFQADEIQIVPYLPPESIQQLRDAGGSDLYGYQQQGQTAPLRFNVQAAPFDELAVRQAVNYAIDKDALVEAALRGQGEPSCGPLAPSVEGYWSDVCDYAPGHAPARAEQMLAEAGWKPGDDGVRSKDGEPLEFTAYTTPEDIDRRAAQLVQEQLAEVGIGMEIQTLEIAALAERASKGDGQAYFLGWGWSQPDAMHQLYHSSQIGTLNVSRYSDPGLDATLDRALTEPDKEARTQLYEDAQKQALDESLEAYLMVREEYVAVQPRIRGVEVIGNFGVLSLHDARVEQ